MGLLLFAAVIIQTVFAFISRPLSTLVAVILGAILFLHQLIIGFATAGFSFLGLFKIPGPVFAALGGIWMIVGLVFLYRLLRHKKETRSSLVEDFLGALKSNGKIYLMVVALMGLMLVVVYPLVALVQHQPVLFRIMGLLSILILSGFLLLRKYRNMEQLDVADTRSGRTRPPLLLRFLYASVFKPLLTILIAIAYLYLLYTAVISPLIATVALVLFTILLTVFSRRIKRILQPGS